MRSSFIFTEKGKDVFINKNEELEIRENDSEK